MLRNPSQASEITMDDGVSLIWDCLEQTTIVHPHPTTPLRLNSSMGINGDHATLTLYFYDYWYYHRHKQSYHSCTKAMWWPEHNIQDNLLGSWIRFYTLLFADHPVLGNKSWYCRVPWRHHPCCSWCDAHRQHLFRCQLSDNEKLESKARELLSIEAMDELLTNHRFYHPQ